jgi:hypothetical protein
MSYGVTVTIRASALRAADYRAAGTQRASSANSIDRGAASPPAGASRRAPSAAACRGTVLDDCAGARIKLSYHRAVCSHRNLTRSVVLGTTKDPNALMTTRDEAGVAVHLSISGEMSHRPAGDVEGVADAARR